MNCYYCGKQLNNNEAVLDGSKQFCNNLCRYLWQQKNAGIISNPENNESKIFLDNLDFKINMENFEDKNLLVRASYWKGPQLLLDNKKLKPVKRQYFKRIKYYQLQDNKGFTHDIKLKNRFLDGVPGIEIDGREVNIFKSLRFYEYLWIFIPAIIWSLGGLIGGIIGWGAIFTNSIIFRKIRINPLKYFLTGVNTAVAFLLFFKAIFLIAPYIEVLKLKTYHGISANELIANSSYSPLTNNIWVVYQILDSQGNDITDKNGPPYKDEFYFLGNGDLTKINSSGEINIGKWEFNHELKSLKIIDPSAVEEFIINRISDAELVLDFNNVQLIFYSKG